MLVNEGAIPAEEQPHVTHHLVHGSIGSGRRAYFAGLVVERQWRSYPSMIVFLAIYFVTLWVAWVIAVWLTEPKKAAA
jgi:hypothetical protein